MDESNHLSRVQTTCLVLLAAVAVGFALHWLRPVLIPFVLALFLAIAVAPLVELLMRHLRLPRTPAAIVAMVLGAAVMGLVALVVSASVAEMSENAGMYQRRAEELLDGALDALPLSRFGVTREDALASLEDSGGRAARRLLVGTSSAITNVLSKGVLVLIFFCFLVFGGSGRSGGTGEWSEVEADVKRYTLAKLVLSAATGVLVGGILTLLGIPLAGVFGLMAFLLNFIPSVGSIIAVLLPLPVVLLTPDVSVARAVLAIALPGLVEFTIGNVIEPRLMGKRLGLHPIAVLMALIFWGMLWGIVGMFLAVPMTVLARRIMYKNEITRPVADLLAGRAPGRDAAREV